MTDADKKLVEGNKALAHPLRVRILELMRGGKLWSPNGISAELDEPLGKVSYHVKTLLDFNALVLVKTEPRRGAVEHFYRATGRFTTDGDANTALDRIASKLTNPKKIGDPTLVLQEVREIVRAAGREV